jgi:hypothetical protein
MIGGFQLLRDEENDWVILKKTLGLWRLKDVNVAYIDFDYKSPIGDRFAAFYEPEYFDNSYQVLQMWEYLKASAAQYPFAEQTSSRGQFDGNIQKWPNSEYFLPPGNNSNSFARWIVKEKANVEVPDLWGVFPGSDLPEFPSYSSSNGARPVKKPSWLVGGIFTIMINLYD